MGKSLCLASVILSATVAVAKLIKRNLYLLAVNLDGVDSGSAFVFGAFSITFGFALGLAFRLYDRIRGLLRLAVSAGIEVSRSS